MAWTEVIMVRSTGGKRGMLESGLVELMNEMDFTSEQPRIRIYNRERVDTDISIVLHHPEEKKFMGPSPLGLRLAAGLRELGQAHHTIWLEMGGG